MVVFEGRKCSLILPAWWLRRTTTLRLLLVVVVVVVVVVVMVVNCSLLRADLMAVEILTR
jgi:uncharacterized membrane protein